MVLIKRMIFLTSTTPAAATASAFPSSAEEGSQTREKSVLRPRLSVLFAHTVISKFPEVNTHGQETGQ